MPGCPEETSQHRGHGAREREVERSLFTQNGFAVSVEGQSLLDALPENNSKRVDVPFRTGA
jgi:hypothetical protein